mmetsp:Transcript_53222/g.163753  ORF Transcript_53222/g.163753 Transcript_53222/m.163753 type:complete len:211 (-) Transcript_53222:71-703(-)
MTPGNRRGGRILQVAFQFGNAARHAVKHSTVLAVTRIVIPVVGTNGVAHPLLPGTAQRRIARRTGRASGRRSRARGRSTRTGGLFDTCWASIARGCGNWCRRGFRLGSGSWRTATRRTCRLGLGRWSFCWHFRRLLGAFRRVSSRRLFDNVNFGAVEHAEVLQGAFVVQIHRFLQNADFIGMQPGDLAANQALQVFDRRIFGDLDLNLIP